MSFDVQCLSSHALHMVPPWGLPFSARKLRIRSRLLAMSASFLLRSRTSTATGMSIRQD